MIKFNSNNLIVGYIKQLLSSFNVPACPIFKNKNEAESFFEDYSIETPIICIIKNFKNNRDSFVKLTKTSASSSMDYYFLDYYIYGKYYNGITKTLNLKNTIYDVDTHNYLGYYLRFLKAYNRLDLMSLYNCYNNSSYINNGYIYSIMDINLNDTYTLFNPSIRPIYYKLVYMPENNINDIIPTKLATMEAATANMTYITTELYKFKETPSTQDISKIIQNKSNCKLIIKTPLDYSYPHIILEGKYKNHNDYITPIEINYDVENRDNYTTLDIEHLMSNQFFLNSYKGVNNTSYPFTDRLIEYLCDNVIDVNDTIVQNIQDAKRNLKDKYLGSSYKITSDITNFDRLCFIQGLNKNSFAKVDKYDILGYVDKDIETVLNDKRFGNKEE